MVTPYPKVQHVSDTHYNAIVSIIKEEEVQNLGRNKSY